jgi:leader peptidase (prepilin peptidase) / N-methyltransferase
MNFDSWPEQASAIAARKSTQRRMMIAPEHAPSRFETLAAAAVGLAAGFASLAVTTPFVAVMTGYLVFTMAVIVLIDLRHFIIPDILSLPAIPLGLLANMSMSESGSWVAALQDSLLAAGVAAGVLFGLRAMYWKFRGVEGLGLGDVKLAAAAGAWVGLADLTITCFIASFGALAAVFVSGLARTRSRPGAKSIRGNGAIIPFGSFIAPAIAIVWIWRLFSHS